MDISDLIKTHSTRIKKPKFFKRSFSFIENIYFKKLNKPYSENSNKISLYFFYVFLILILLFIVKLAQIQIFNYEVFHTLSNKNYLRSEVINPSRGLITDRNGNLLVKNVPKYVLNQNISKCLIIKDKNFERCREEIKILRKYVDFDEALISNSYDVEKLLIVIKKEITKDEAIQIGSLKDLKSIEITIVPLREYTFPKSMSQIIGYVGQSSKKVGEYEGKQGVEDYYNEVLSGIAGQTLYKSDSMNNKLEDYNEISAISGKDIKLAISGDLQDFSYQLLE